MHNSTGDSAAILQNKTKKEKCILHCSAFLRRQYDISGVYMLLPLRRGLWVP